MAISNSPVENHRNWLELPSDVTLMILMKVSALEIYKRVQFVCKMWHNLCKEPYMWQTIHINTLDEAVSDEEKIEKMMIDFIDRSAGGLIDLKIEGFASDLFFSHLANQSTQLKRLRLATCDITEKTLIGALESLSSLEELEITLCFYQHENTVPIIKSCPFLTVLKLNQTCSKRPESACDYEAVAIAGNMPKLRHLQLIGNSLTDDGLTTILDGCPHLQSLDLRACLHVKLVENLEKRLSEQIKDVRRPYDSTDDYNYPTIATEVSFPDDDDYRYGYPYDSDYSTYMSDEEHTLNWWTI